MKDDLKRFSKDLIELDQELIEMRRMLRNFAGDETFDQPSPDQPNLDKLRDDLRSRIPELKAMLADHAATEEKKLFPAAQRVLGCELDELNVLRDEQKVLQWRLDRLVEFVENGPADEEDGQAWFRKLRGMCDAMAATFEAHTMHEATFFNLNHDLLFPGKVFTG